MNKKHDGTSNSEKGSEATTPSLPMGHRGVTRPMEEMASRDDQIGDDSEEHGHDEGHDHEMSQDDRLNMLRVHHKQTLWIYWTLPLIGLWLIFSPFSFGYLNDELWVDPSGGRGPWFFETSTPQLSNIRAWLMTLSDILCGVLLLIFGWRSLTPNRPKSLWACCFVGAWLTFAPVIFWAPTMGAYLNDSILGILVISLTILIPGMPNMIMYMQHGPPQPPGWTYNPSSWAQRWIMIILGLLGLFVSRYIAMFQLGYIDYVWDPFFGFKDGSKAVLNSKMSHMWPISDAALGAVSYTFEFLMGYMGSPSRWRTMPWMVAFFGLLVIPLGLTHILLVISQPVLVHHWCTMCLLAALIMLPMLPLEVDEVVAMIQHVVQAKRRGDRGNSLWKIFWLGGKADGCTPDERSPEMLVFPQQPKHVYISSIWGMSFPWTLTVSSILGVILMFCPTWFGIDIKTGAADIAHLGGALIVTVAVICMGEVVRLGRYLNVLIGIGIVIGTWFMPDSTTAYSAVNSVLAGAVVLLSIPRGPKTESYGSWDKYIR